MTKESYTPLREALTSWWTRAAKDMWILISDGGDSTPKESWPGSFAELSENSSEGLLIGFSDKEQNRLWIHDVKVAPLSFEGQASHIEIHLERARKTLNAETVQIQVLLKDKVLVSENIFMYKPRFGGGYDVWGVDEVKAKLEYINGKKIDLQPKEFALLEYLVRNKNRIVSKTMIMERVWNYDFDPGTNVVETHISRLRAKVDKPFDRELIETVRGAGYRIAV